MTTTSRKIYQIKIGLNDAKPPIWRRVLLDSSVSLSKFHDIIQIVMGWTDSHLHQFRAGETYYGIPDPNIDFMETLDERRYKLNHLLKKEKESIRYEYDFGDSWDHKITLEKVLPFDPAATLPHCIKGKGACPPEDVGGIFGYYDFIAAVSDPTHPDHADRTEWVGGDFDPDLYNIDEVNALLLKHCKA
ncbi:plasmid pRiA4b ORF-3 family protein [uncultured Thiodictyon sp.]|uniref:plasmid pRiA4b ORF-3 family protein n=1 Tax=uncultured Thiodictyon sp. TaxID=1846217 RepID=UPI0025E48A75|nr:plasmid pRiA4b ORF-3 family protein [uncultured Thiodictyon sp.]